MAAQPTPGDQRAAHPALGRSMPAALAESLRAQIHSGQLSPGDRLPNERDFAALLGVGRITMREAIRVLVTDGYLVSKRGNCGGTFVTDLAQPHQAWLKRIEMKPGWIDDLFEYRKAVEMRAAELAALRHSAEHLEEMRQAIEEGADPASRSAFRLADHHFHVAVAVASGSERLTAAITGARGELFVPTDQFAFPDHFAQTHDEHAQILAAIEAHDAEGAREAAEAHLNGSLKDFLEMVLKIPGA
jgi:GntR family transcriptional repressor for pyruvate dehydrogenase complex